MEDLYIRQKSIKLKTEQSISVIGCGGIGFWVTKYLALSGIKTLYVYDPDIIEVHNLNRIDVPLKYLGTNKADIVRIMVNSIRPDITIYSFPLKYTENTSKKTDWVIDCTDNAKSQSINQEIADKLGCKYFKAGYDGENFSISNRVAEWGEGVDGYQIIPSWVVPASIVAAMAVAKVMKYDKKEVVSNVENMFRVDKR